MFIEKINSPEDLKKLNLSEMETLASEIRTALIEKVSRRGGHFAPNMGMVEATIALHYVFESPKDKIVFDVSHQSYPHKILTGRKDAFINPDKYSSVSGYTNPKESPHDFFEIGHTSTAVSLASGLAKARDLLHQEGNVIAVLGDGSLSGGEALEGLDYAADLNSNFIVLFNDNQMSIAENHGGVYRNLEDLRKSNGKCECNFFKAMGFNYLYVDKGNDISSLIEAFKQVKDCACPTVVHINTLKGKGYKFAEADKENWHANGPFDVATGKPLHESNEESYFEITGEFLSKKIKEDSRVVAINAATPMVFGFDKKRREEAGSQYVDVGIAEEHAVALASALAKGGAKPVMAAFATFMQRTFDQLVQDLCINKNPAVFLTFLSGIYGMNDITHLGILDIQHIANIPNMVYLAPTCKEEYIAMLEWAMAQNDHPVAIRVQSNGVIKSGVEDKTDYSILNKYEVKQKGNNVAIMALGSFFELGKSIASDVEKALGEKPTLINPKFISGIDEELMEELKKNHKIVITLEDGILDGGWGEKIARYFGASDVKVLNYGLKKEFVDRYKVEELLKENRITSAQIIEDIRKQERSSCTRETSFLV